MRPSDFKRCHPDSESRQRTGEEAIDHGIQMPAIEGQAV
jgi:hypothetical protein